MDKKILIIIFVLLIALLGVISANYIVNNNKNTPSNEVNVSLNETNITDNSTNETNNTSITNTDSDNRIKDSFELTPLNPDGTKTHMGIIYKKQPDGSWVEVGRTDERLKQDHMSRQEYNRINNRNSQITSSDDSKSSTSQKSEQSTSQQSKSSSSQKSEQSTNEERVGFVYEY